MTGYLGVIKFFAGNFAPRNWRFCTGEILTISQFTELFSIIGAGYGGDGRTTFALPNLKQRVAIGAGTGPGLSSYALAQVGGDSGVPLTLEQMPKHKHRINAKNANGDKVTAANNYPAISNGNITLVGAEHSYQSESYLKAEPTVTMSDKCMAQAGDNRAHNNMQPYLVCNYIICVAGMYPTRS